MPVSPASSSAGSTSHSSNPHILRKPVRHTTEKLGAHNTRPGQVGGIWLPVTPKSPVHCSCYMTCILPSRSQVHCRQSWNLPLHLMYGQHQMINTIAYQYVKFYHSRRFFSYSPFLLLTGLFFQLLLQLHS